MTTHAEPTHAEPTHAEPTHADAPAAEGRGRVGVPAPRLARAGDDAEVTRWHRAPGERVEAGEPLADLETDKVVLEVVAPAAGVLAEILAPVGATVAPGDVLAVVATREEADARTGVPPAVPAEPGEPAGRPGGGRREPMSRIRRRIGENLMRAQSTQAMVTTVSEVDLTAVRHLRERYNSRPGGAPRTRLGIVPFFVKAAVAALRRFPVVNATIDGPDVVHRDRYDLGVAVATDRGLLVPVVRDAGRRSFTELEEEIQALAARARSGRLDPADLQDGTFTITNGGVYGSLLSTPIINHPQCAILGLHAIQDRPVVVDGDIVVRPMMYTALTYDHRLVDGSEAVQFLGEIKRCLEEPRRLLADE
ncbi:2-oxo acid dehydrogenase subunit E2 [Kitasatospora sp. NBC_01287]|uniref:2-oxo acid dehydrogenase subunit E2 n=1 Tax=Kitasatospora sp. NBC_01287 TaxID=2903573 RepID=UPI0022584943|nr:2-oxo acid dehydrogenase subunit E2 [Kitasatospora sp. NBC_01287]MCX4743989.1 2-oxo acid dehydrogenase subunit E2 [Kitasatospora sp. NBC_01287]